MKNYPQSRQSNIVVQEFETEILIYDLKINKAYCLNQTSALVYQLCDGTNSVTEISNLMSKKLKALVTEDLIWLALDELKKDNLLEQSDELEIKFGGLSRREVIRKVGFASMVMLPIISSIIAPTSAMAQSGGIALLQACPTNTGCAPGLNCITCTGGSCNGSLTCCQGIGTSGPGVEIVPPSSCGANNQSGCNGYNSSCCSGFAQFVSRPGCVSASGGCICG